MAELSDKEIEQLESELPKRFIAATHHAFERAVNSGARVLIGKDGGIYEIVDGGEPQFVRKIKPLNVTKKNGKLTAS